MLYTLKDFKRPPADNGRGVHGPANHGWTGSDEGLDFWIAELQALGVKWFKLVDERGDSIPVCERLVKAGIFPVVRILRHDPPPNDSPEPNPGHLNPAEEETIRKLIDAGVLYFETNNEPDNPSQWKGRALAPEVEEAARLVALNWLFDARVILDLGGYPGLPAIGNGKGMDLIGALVSLGRQDILINGCWLALHNYPLNRPLDYPNDTVNQSGAPVMPGEYDYGPLTDWVWWDLRGGRAGTLDEINQFRAANKQPGSSILQEHACFREYEYYFSLMQKYLGRPIPIISTETGPLPGRREDMRYPRMTPQQHAETTCAILDFMQRQAPDYYFAAMPWLLISSPGTEQDAWYSDFWRGAFEKGTRVQVPVPHFAVPGVEIGNRLPVVSLAKNMPVNARGLTIAADTASSPLDTPEPQVQGQSYTVERGETLPSIAKKFGTNITAIVKANKIADPSRVTTGDVLIIPAKPAPPPPPRASIQVRQITHTVQAGETLATLAYHLNTTISAIVASNNLSDPTAIRVGQSLIIPIPSSVKPRPTPGATPPPPGLKPKSIPRPPSRPRGLEQFDPRLGALGVGVSHAMIVPGVVYWRLTGIAYLDPTLAQSEKGIECRVLDQKGDPVGGQRVLTRQGEDQRFEYTDHNGEAHLSLVGPYWPERGGTGESSVWVDGLPGDRVTGLGLPNGQNVNFLITWQKAIK